MQTTTMHCENCKACNINVGAERELYLKKGAIENIYKELNGDKKKGFGMYHLYYKISKNVYRKVVRCSICNEVMWCDKPSIKFPEDECIKNNGDFVKKEKHCVVNRKDDIYLWHKNPKLIGKSICGNDED